ncbi:F0F1 ATP synthase subunit alpha, partial [Enterococcus faecium]
IPVDSILDFEHELFEYLDTNHSDIFETIRTTKDLPEEETLNSAIQEYKDMFLATKGNNSSTEDKLKSIQNA